MSNQGNSTTAPVVSTATNPEVTLEAMIARHNAAIEAANNRKGPLEDSPEEVEMHAAMNAFFESSAKLTSFDGLVAALRLADKENEDFECSVVSAALVKGALAYLEAQTAKARLSDLLRQAGQIIRDNPDLAVERITINHDGVHTLIKIPVTEEHSA
ncbi:hypothetical protein G3A56_09285 [Rhizobium oryzihabitans]|uniref:Uncharacterized protein n=1 Tax=Rhizobium oryzihabitans TaxID=2267833 RepID=A0A7L5BGY7_9HYPH|nr:hypothetical protein [Rhizobium oryzihabitans]QIB38160.1 hypothetical protein G3A56_09285 [Rhizobium oryzihabitans]